MRLQPVPHSLSCSLYLSQGSHVITLLTTVMCRGREPPELPPSGRVKQGQGLLTSDDDPAVPLVPMPPYAPLLRASSHCRSLLGFEPLPQLTRKKKKKKKKPNKLRRPMRRPVSLSLSPSRPSRQRETAVVISEITLLKMNVGLEECVIVPLKAGMRR